MTSDFRKQLEKAYKIKVEGALEKAVKNVAGQVHGKLVEETPVGNPSLWKTNYPPKGYVGGTAKLSWNLSVDKVDLTVTSPKDRIPGSYSGDKSLDALSSFKLGNKVYIANGLPYIRRLNDGHSSQQPEGFIEEAIQVGIRKGIEATKAEIDRG
ncbi:MAG: hypothetical protein ACQEQL_04470 [Pseudomonadota bacterium]